MSKKLLFLNNLKSERLLTEFTINKTTDLVKLPVHPITKYRVISESETIPPLQTYIESFRIKYVVNGHELIITEQDIDCTFDDSNKKYFTYNNTSIMTTFNSYLIDGENTIKLYDLNGTVNNITFCTGSSEGTNMGYGSYIQKLVSINFVPKYCSIMFMVCENLTSLDLSTLNTSNTLNMNAMFLGCVGLTSLDLSNFNTSNVTDMSYMFYSCTNLTSLNISSFNTSKVTNMSYMFTYCMTLSSLNISSFNTSNVTDMNAMFLYCAALTSLDLSNFNTSNVTNMPYMFAVCTALTSLDLSSFNTSNVTDMSSMFDSCIALTSLNLSNFNLNSIVSIESMFADCTVLTRANIALTNVSSADITKLETAGMPLFIPIFSVYNQSTSYLNSTNLITKDISTVKFNVKDIIAGFEVEYAYFCRITYDGTSKLNLQFSDWSNGTLTKGQIDCTPNVNYYVVATKNQNNMTNFKIYIENLLVFDNSYNVQAQPDPVNFQIHGCYINLLEAYDCNIKS